MAPPKEVTERKPATIHAAYGGATLDVTGGMAKAAPLTVAFLALVIAAWTAWKLVDLQNSNLVMSAKIDTVLSIISQKGGDQ